MWLPLNVGSAHLLRQFRPVGGHYSACRSGLADMGDSRTVSHISLRSDEGQPSPLSCCRFIIKYGLHSEGAMVQPRRSDSDPINRTLWLPDSRGQN
jgi:hypothetical protein